MRRVTAIPEPKEIIHCEKHGDFEARYMQIRPDSFYVSEFCSKCVAEQKIVSDERERIEKEKQDIENEKIYQVNIRIRAGISKRNMDKTFDDYIVSNDGQQYAKNSAKAFVDSFPSDKSLLMIGSVGTGKTLLVSAMVDSLVNKYKCRIEKASDIMRNFKSTWSKDSDTDEQAVADYYIGLDLLIIDEVGTQFGSDTEKLFMFEIIDGRYQDMKETILISNLDIDGVSEVIGQRCLDRLREGGGSMIAFDWDSQRK